MFHGGNKCNLWYIRNCGDKNGNHHISPNNLPIIIFVWNIHDGKEIK